MRAFVLLLAALALLVGCGDDNSEGGDSGDGASGTGYTVEPPSGWSENTEQTEGGAIRVDLLLAKSPTGGFATNVNVLRETPPQKVELAQLKSTYEQQLTSLGATDVQSRPDVQIDGEQALANEYRLEQGGRKLRGRQVVLPHGDAVYTITFTATEQRFDADSQEFQAILDSWQWE